MLRVAGATAGAAAAIGFTDRVAASAGSALLMATALAAALLVVQIGLGAPTIVLELPPASARRCRWA